jgi:transcriptional regulator with GAF, ATPase, and Fis domain
VVAQPVKPAVVATPAAKPAAQVAPAARPAVQAGAKLEPASLKALARALDGVNSAAAAPSGGAFTAQIEQIRQAGQRDEVVAILLNAIAPLADHAALFVIQQRQFACLDGRGPSHVIDMLKWVQLSTEEPSPFTAVVAAKEPHLGPLPHSAENQAAMTALGSSSGPLLLVPLMFKGRGIGVLYADELKRDLKPLIADLKLIADEAATAFARIILQRKKSG